ncbi:MAG: toxin-antitoxin system YwqK family antitoxin [Candidatus Omnitrophota bacterium]
MTAFAPTGNALENPENGLYKEYYPNGSLKTTAYYHNAKPHGYVREYYENGKMKSSIRYENGTRYGDFFYYYENGMVKERKLFNQKGELDSNAYTYLEDGTLISDVEYRDGKPTGRKRQYYPNGVIKLTVKCNNYEVICTFVKYRDDGSPIQEYQITNGVVDESSRIVYSGN